MNAYDDYNTYLEQCEIANVQPLARDAELAMLGALWALGEHVIPYVSPTGAIWVHDMRHKTKRRDRPFMVANMTALKEK